MIDELLRYLKDGTEEYLNLKKIVAEEDINEVLEMAVTLAKMGLRKEHVERIVRFTEGTALLQICGKLEGIVAELESIGEMGK